MSTRDVAASAAVVTLKAVPYGVAAGVALPVGLVLALSFALPQAAAAGVAAVLTFGAVLGVGRVCRLTTWLDRAVNAVGAWADWAVYDDAGRRVAASVTEFHARASAVAEFIDRHGPAERWTAARWDEFENVVAYRTAVLAREIRGGRS